MVQRVNRMAAEFDAERVVLDPAVPLGLIGPSLRLPYDVVLHGAEVTVPGRLPVSRQALAYVLRGARHVIAGGSYPAAEAERAAGRALPITIVPPGVDTERFRPLTAVECTAARAEFGLPDDAQVIACISRMVPRKGFDMAIRAAAALRDKHPDLILAISGGGRDETRLRQLAADVEAPVRFLGRVTNEQLPRLYGCADLYSMLCRSRWVGLEQEGFGIVFLEAAACGVPQVGGDSGGAGDALLDGVTGLLAKHPDDLNEVVEVFDTLLSDHSLRLRMAIASRQRVEAEFSYDLVAARLGRALQVDESRGGHR
jgi:phosphatidylinositol alpha-1,6-mannosyltransferase